MNNNMKYILLACALFTLRVHATLELVPISAFPAVSSVDSNMLFVIAIPGIANRSVQFYTLNGQILTNTLNNLSTNTSFWSNLVNSSSSTINNLYQSIAPVDMFHVINMNTNMIVDTVPSYWINCGVTNSHSQTNIYGTLTATNSVLFLGVTNAVRGSLFSFNVVAQITNQILYIPTNFPHLTTNGLSGPTNITSALYGTTNGYYSLVLTNGNEFRFTFQSNSTHSTIWTTFGQ